MLIVAWRVCWRSAQGQFAASKKQAPTLVHVYGFTQRNLISRQTRTASALVFDRRRSAANLSSGGGSLLRQIHGSIQYEDLVHCFAGVTFTVCARRGQMHAPTRRWSPESAEGTQTPAAAQFLTPCSSTLSCFPAIHKRTCFLCQTPQSPRETQPGCIEVKRLKPKKKNKT